MGQLASFLDHPVGQLSSVFISEEKIFRSSATLKTFSTPPATCGPDIGLVPLGSVARDWRCAVQPRGPFNKYFDDLADVRILRKTLKQNEHNRRGKVSAFPGWILEAVNDGLDQRELRDCSADASVFSGGQSPQEVVSFRLPGEGEGVCIGNKLRPAP